MTVDLGNAPVPERKYLAETCEVRLDRGRVKLLFGQERIGKAELRSLLVIHLSPSAITRFLDSLAQMSPSLELAAAAMGFTPDRGAPITEEPRQTVALGAGILLAAMSNEEGCLDFFQASPFAMGSAVSSRKLALDPVVRVDMSAPLLLFLIAELRRIAPQFPPSLVSQVEMEKNK